MLGVFMVALYYLPIVARAADHPDADFAWSLLAGTVIIYVIVALGLNVVVGMAGLLDLGYVGFYAVGAYTVGILGSAHANLAVAAVCLPIAVAVAMLSGVLLGAPTLRLRGDYLAIVTLGFGEIIRLLAERFEWLGEAGHQQHRRSRPASVRSSSACSTPKPLLARAHVLAIIVYSSSGASSAAASAGPGPRSARTRTPPSSWACPPSSSSCGPSPSAPASAAWPGTLYASKGNYVAPDLFQLKVSILFLAAVVLGGPGNRPGVVVGAIVVSYLPERFRFLDTSRYFWFGVVLVVMMIFRPQGLWPRRQHGRRTEPPSSDPPPFEDVREGDPDLEGGAHGAATPA